MEIRWSARAQNDYDKILQYLKENWSLKEIQSFLAQTERVLSTIQNNPKIFIESPKRKNVR